MSTNVTNPGPFLRTSREFPADLHNLSHQINKSYVDIANAVNNRIIGTFARTRPSVTGEEWYIANGKQQTLRQVYTFGNISSGTELDIPTNITSFVEFTKIYGTAITNVIDYRPLPFVDAENLGEGMGILVGTVSGIQQIRIILGTNAPDVTSGIVVLEWLVNV